MRALIITVVSCIILVGIFFLLYPPCDTRDYLHPYSSTVFSSHYSKNKFNSIQKGMTINDVENLIGKPLKIDTIFLNGKPLSFEYNYTKKNGCHEWYVVLVQVNKNLIVTEKGEGWRDY
jgi:outer membrane protein assembly factor BamE (lipoprotein component of BamABCDE complex)